MVGYLKKQLGPPSVNIPALFDSGSSFIEEAKNLDLDTMDRYELLKVANSFRVVIIVYAERLSNLSVQLSEKEKEIVRLREENLALRDKISRMEIPDYIPQDQRIQEWLKGREFEYEKQRAEIEKDKILAQGKVVTELGEVLKNNDYAPHAITSLLKHATGVKTQSGDKSIPNPALESRISGAEKMGFTWQTRGSKRPSRESTCLKLLTKWEEEYEMGKSVKLCPTINVDSVVKMGDGAMCAVINTIKEVVGKEIDLGSSKNNYNKLQKAVKIYKLKERGTTPIPYSPHILVAEKLTEAVFGPNILPDERKCVVSIYAERLNKYKGVENITPGLIRKACHLNRLPTFFEWREEHKSSHDRLRALKQGEYDHEYKLLLEKLLVESKGRGGG